MQHVFHESQIAATYTWSVVKSAQLTLFNWDISVRKYKIFYSKMTKDHLKFKPICYVTKDKCTFFLVLFSPYKTWSLL